MLLGTLGASLLGKLLTGKGIVGSIYGNKKGNGAIAKRQGRGIVRASYVNKIDF